MKNYKNKLNKELNKIVITLKNKYKPEKIILFGSTASGNIHDWSDLDLVVIKKTEKSFYDRIDEVSRLIDHEVPTDIIVYTPDEFEEMKSDNYFVRDEIIKSGKIIYAN